jgi:hypothetical protein
MRKIKSMLVFPVMLRNLALLNQSMKYQNYLSFLYTFAPTLRERLTANAPTLREAAARLCVRQIHIFNQ